MQEPGAFLGEGEPRRASPRALCDVAGPCLSPPWLIRASGSQGSPALAKSERVCRRSPCSGVSCKHALPQPPRQRDPGTGSALRSGWKRWFVQRNATTNQPTNADKAAHKPFHFLASLQSERCTNSLFCKQRRNMILILQIDVVVQKWRV